ncbi:MAG TPA: pentapeptide repeat-containing protein [Caulobacteraceae bacterium]|nr:pentapeptide repeat-containing protein [Caulobacteraceae bacterium]
MSRACLRHADLRGARARKARFLAADRDFAKLEACDLSGAELEV